MECVICFPVTIFKICGPLNTTVRYRCKECEISYSEKEEFYYKVKDLLIFSVYCKECVRKYAKTNLLFYIDPEKTIKSALRSNISICDLINIIVRYAKYW